MNNEKLETINIKGKNYVEVNTRVMEFKTNPKYEGWSIESEIVTLSNDQVVFKTSIRDAQGRVISTGFAQEDRNSSQVNSTSYLENCETSAVGRALGFLGIGIKTSIASANEVANAIHQQASQAPKYNQSQGYQRPVQQTPANNYQEEYVTVMYGDNSVQYKKAFNKQRNQYFYVICDDSLLQYGCKKFISVEEMNQIQNQQ